MSTLSPYASELAHARLDALRTLIDAMNEADTPDEKRRCAVAIFNAPDPCQLDDAIELEEGDDNENDANEDAANEDSDTRLQTNSKDDAPAEVPQQEDPASTSHIRDRSPHIDSPTSDIAPPTSHIDPLTSHISRSIRRAATVPP